VPDASAQRTSREQDAFRLLVLIDAGGGPIDDLAPPAALAMVKSQMRLQALDFWLRNPDYLANEFLNEFESGSRGIEAVAVARSIIDSAEPELRRYPMVRYRFGAYEPLDDALAILKLHAYIAIRRKAIGSRVGQHRYYLLRPGGEALSAILAEAPDLVWYADRARLVMDLAGTTGGKALKDRQYLDPTYKGTPLSSRILPITELVRARLEGMPNG
jgi:hypothetical protein